MTAAKKAKRTKTVKTRFGTVDRKGYEDLRDSYSTFVLLDAIDAIDQVRYCIDEMRENTMAVHGMAMNILNDNHAAPGGRVPDLPIWEITDQLTGDIRQCIEYLEIAYEAIRPLESLMPDPDDEREDAA